MREFFNAPLLTTFNLLDSLQTSYQISILVSIGIIATLLTCHLYIKIEQAMPYKPPKQVKKKRR